MVLKYFENIAKNERLFLSITIIIMAIFSVLTTNFSKAFRGDEFHYLLKAFEMKYGNWEVFKTDTFGYPVVMFTFLKILNINTLYDGMILSRVLTILFTLASIFPIYLLSKKIISTPFHFLPVIFYIFSSSLIFHSGNGMTEPAFVFFTMFSLYFLSLKSNLKNLIIASFFAALSYYIRFNGSFLFATIVFFHLYLVFKKESKWYYLFLIFGVFITTLLPDFYLRYITHGTIFDYGVNSKYFIDDYTKVWFNNTKSPSLVQFFTESNFSVIFRKFFVNGFFKVCLFIFDSFGIILSALTLIGIFKILKSNDFVKFLPIAIFLAINLAGLSMVFEVYFAERHVYILLPVLFIIASYTFTKFNFKHFSAQFPTTLILGIYFIVNVSMIIPNIKKSNFAPIKEDEWAVWTTKNISGKLYMMSGTENIRTVLLNKDIQQVKHPISFAKYWNFWLVRPEYYETIDDFYSFMKNSDGNYFIFFKNEYECFPMFKTIHSAKWSDKYKLIKTFPEKNPEVEIFEIK